MVRSFRDALSRTLLQIAEEDQTVIVLTPDLARAVRIQDFSAKYGSQFVSGGISEANLVGVAAGLASVGMMPIIVGFSMFVAEKPFEQIRNIIAYPDFNVKIIATHGGICVGKDGATHQAIEDLAIMRILPQMRVFAACDVSQTESLIQTICSSTGPSFLRLGRDEAQDIYENDGCITNVGGADVLRDGSDVAIVAIGTMVGNALQAAEELEKEGVDAAVINAYSLKPLNESLLLSYFDRCGCVVTAEDHLVAGGLGGAICELSAKKRVIPVECVGVMDRFGESGNQAELYEKYALTPQAIVAASRKVMGRKHECE